STGPPSLPAEITTVTPAATTSLITVCSALVQVPVPPRLMLLIWAGWVLSGTPLTCRPAAHRIASRQSGATPPHFPNTRNGRTFGCHGIPVMPVALLESAPSMPATRVPCQELFSAVHPLNLVVATSAELTQSPGSEASASLPSPSLATKMSVT